MVGQLRQLGELRDQGIVTDAVGGSEVRFVGSDLVDLQMVRVLESLVVVLEGRFPMASPAMVHDSIDEAIRSFRGARVQQFLPILIERSASERLRAVVLGVGR